MQREFTLWNKDMLIQQTKAFGWNATDFSDETDSLFRGSPAHWLNFFFAINKPD